MRARSASSLKPSSGWREASKEREKRSAVMIAGFVERYVSNASFFHYVILAMSRDLGFNCRSAQYGEIISAQWMYLSFVYPVLFLFTAS